MGFSKCSVLVAGSVLVAALAGAPAARAESFAAPAVSAYWVENTFNALGVSGVNAFGAPAVSGGQLVGAIPTDTPVRTGADGGNQGYEDVTALAVSASQVGASTYYNGVFLGNLTSKTGLNATFTLTNSNIATGTPFVASDFGGEAPPLPANLRLFFKDAASPDPENDSNVDQWWYNPGASFVTNLSAGIPDTMSADFTDLAGWSDSDGHLATAYPAAFESALGNVTDLGLSFGSGSFFLDGFGYASSVGGTGSIQLQSINVPEPALLGLIGLVALAVPTLRRRGIRFQP